MFQSEQEDGKTVRRLFDQENATGTWEVRNDEW
jgi:hypothetical protein